MLRRAVALALSLFLALQPLQPAWAAGVKAVAPTPQSVAALAGFLNSPAPAWANVQGLGAQLMGHDLADPAAVDRLKPVTLELQAAAQRLVEAPLSPKATEADLAAASQKLSLLNQPGVRNLLTPEQQRLVGAAFWAYHSHLYEDVRADHWQPSKLTLAQKIEGIARALDASRAMPAGAQAETLRPNTKVTFEALAADASQVKADALISAVQLHGFCHGGINAMIEREGGSCYSRQVEAAKPLVDGRTLVAKGDAESKAKFDHVVFVADDMRQPLHQLVLNALTAADDAGLKHVSLPALRTGWNFGFLEKSYDEVAAETVKGVNLFLAAGRKSVEKISFVVHNNPRLLSLLEAAAKKDDPEREALRKAALSGAGYELTPRPRDVPASDLRSPIHTDMLAPWDLARMLSRRTPLKVDEINDRAAFSAPAPASVLNLPIKMPGTGFHVPAELEQYRETLQKIVDYEASVNPRLGEFYAYLTVDHGLVKKGDTHRRPGIHIDGVQGSRYGEKMPPEHTYSASDAVGTVFYAQSFDLRHIDPDRDYIHGELERQADEKNAVATSDYGIYHWDSYSAHRAAIADKDTPRTFLRVEFSKKVYDSAGDTVSPLFDYDWPRLKRPIPYELNWHAERLAKVTHEAGRRANSIAVEFAEGTDPEVAKALLKRAHVRAAKDVAPAVRALSKEPAVAKLTVSAKIPPIWDLVVDYPHIDGRTAFPELGRPVDDKTLIEGSKSGGGSQADFLVDHADPVLRERVLLAARAIGASKRDDWTKLRALQTLVRSVIPRDGWRDNRGNKAYDNFVAATAGRAWVTLGDYVRLGIGVCRENALLTVVALRAAGYKARYAYFKVYKADGTVDSDHALALVDVDGTTYVLDSYARLGRYFNGHRLADLLQAPADGQYPLASPLASGNADNPGRWTARLNPFPRLRPAP
jgi:O-acetyl-ADP-ribose deacetylase (regulator of RNase III)